MNTAGGRSGRWLALVLLLCSPACSGTSDQTLDPTQDEPSPAEQREIVRTTLESLVVDYWSPPDSIVAHRVSRVRLFFGPRGRAIGWAWESRSGHEVFDRSVRDYLEWLVGAPREFPIPPPEDPLFYEILEQGLTIRFADT